MWGFPSLAPAVRSRQPLAHARLPGSDRGPVPGKRRQRWCARSRCGVGLLCRRRSAQTSVPVSPRDQPIAHFRYGDVLNDSNPGPFRNVRHARRRQPIREIDGAAEPRPLRVRDRFSRKDVVRQPPLLGRAPPARLALDASPAARSAADDRARPPNPAGGRPPPPL